MGNLREGEGESEDIGHDRIDLDHCERASKMVVDGVVEEQWAGVTESD